MKAPPDAKKAARSYFEVNTYVYLFASHVCVVALEYIVCFLQDSDLFSGTSLLAAFHALLVVVGFARRR